MSNAKADIAVIARLAKAFAKIENVRARMEKTKSILQRILNTTQKTISGGLLCLETNLRT